jgi:predicted dehydrogenase
MMAQIGHLPFYLDDRRCEVVAIADERPSIASALAERLGSHRVVRDRAALLGRPDIDAIVLCAPRTATGPLTLEILEAGKHVLAEKPMAHTAAQARRLVDAARAGQRTYAVGFMKRYDPGVQAAKAMFDDTVCSGRLGQLLLARFYDYSKAYAVVVPAHVRPRESRPVRYPNWPTWPDWLPEQYRSTYEWFLNAASHDVNLVTYFFPGALGVDGARARRDGSMIAALRSGDVPIALEIARTEAGVWLEGAEFLFEHGRIVLTLPSPLAMDKVASVCLDDLRAGVPGQPVETPRGWCFARQAAGFIDALTDVARPLTSGEAGLSDMELIEAIWRRIQE